MKIWLDKELTFRYAKGISYDGVEFVTSSSQGNADLFFFKLHWSEYIKDINRFQDNPNHVVYVDFTDMRVRQHRNLRKNYNVDNCIDIPYEKIANIIFSDLDFHKKKNIVPVFTGPTPNSFLKKEQAYWVTDKLPKNDTFHNNVFWKARQLTHDSRKVFFDFYKDIDDPRFEIEEFELNIYQGQGESTQFDSYMNELCQKDIVFVLRGDRPWAYSFFDVIRAGCIPVMLSSMNDFGWENILNNVDDYFLCFDIRTQTMEHIHEKVCELLDDKSRVLQMKANIRKLYRTFFNHASVDGASEFIWGKCLNIYENNFDLSKVDDKFICSEVLALKGLDGKL